MECNHTITFRVRSSRKWILIEFTIKLGGSLLYILLATFLQFLNKNACRTIYWGSGLDLKGDTTTYSIQKF